MKNRAIYALLILAMSSSLFAAVEVDEVNCAGQIYARKKDRADELLVDTVMTKYSRPRNVAESLVKALGRRKVYWDHVDTEWFNQIEDACNPRRIEGMWQEFLVADFTESLPRSLTLPKAASRQTESPMLENHPGLSYVLDVVTLPSEAVITWLTEEDFSKPAPVYAEYKLPLLPWPLVKARMKAMTTARRNGQKFLMENQNGTFTPLSQRPTAGTFYSLEPLALESEPEEPQVVQGHYAIISEDTGRANFVAQKPTLHGTEFLIFDDRGENGRVIGRGTVGVVKHKKQKHAAVNLLEEEWDESGELRRDKTVVHQIVLRTIIDRLAVDIFGITEEANLPAARKEVREELIRHLQLNRTYSFLDAIESYLKRNDPIRFEDFMGPEPEENDEAVN